MIFGDNNNPGQMTVETPITNPSIMAGHEGVYTCKIPNESDDYEYLRIGIYLRGSSGEGIRFYNLYRALLLHVTP